MEITLPARSTIRVEFAEGPVEAEVRFKGDWKILDLWCPVLVWIAGVFSPEFKRRFYEDFSTAIRSTIYLRTGGETPERVGLGHLAHEARHVYQYLAGRLAFVFGYVFRRSRRFFFESDAVQCGQLAFSEDGSEFYSICAHWAGLLSSSMYLWAASSESDAYARLVVLARLDKPKITIAGKDTISI